jgi:hypothetical protein
VPYLDKITFSSAGPTVAVLRLKNGRVDVVGDGIPPAQFPSVLADPASKDLLVMGDWLPTAYVTNERDQAAFDKLEVRQAVNMAINRDRIVRLINNRAVPTGQVLPPALPGYDPNNKGYSHDPKQLRRCWQGRLSERAFNRALCDECRSAPAHRPGDPAGSRGDRHQGRDQVAGTGRGHRCGGRRTAPMVWSGGMGWLTDFPDPPASSERS